MLDLTVPPDRISWASWLTQLRYLSKQHLPKARRIAMLRLIWQEAYLPCEGLIIRVEDLLGAGCFEPSPHRTFRHDLVAVRQALNQAGYRLAYSRQPEHQGYYIQDRPALDNKLRRLITGAVAEVDPAQVKASKHLTPAQRFHQGNSMTRLAEQVATYRLHQRRPHLSKEKARQIIRERD